MCCYGAFPARRFPACEYSNEWAARKTSACVRMVLGLLRAGVNGLGFPWTCSLQVVRRTQEDSAPVLPGTVENQHKRSRARWRNALHLATSLLNPHLSQHPFVSSHQSVTKTSREGWRTDARGIFPHSYVLLAIVCVTGTPRPGWEE